MSNQNKNPNPNPNQGYYEVEAPKDDESVVSPEPQEIQEIINLINLQNNLVGVGGGEEPAAETEQPEGGVEAAEESKNEEIEEQENLETPQQNEGESDNQKPTTTNYQPTTKSEEVSASKFVIIKDIVENIKNELSRITELLSGSVSQSELEELSKKLIISKTVKEEPLGLKIIEGVFDGEEMVGEDGNKYPIPPNYASKSKLVEGDLLKLTIKQDGSFVYKQIAPIERKRVVGILAYDEGPDQYYVLGEGKKWKVLRASVTYFKGEPGDEVTIVVPRDAPSQWAAVENILKK